jgi:ABC-type uncharacterized transport system ATPase subunit
MWAMRTAVSSSAAHAASTSSIGGMVGTAGVGASGAWRVRSMRAARPETLMSVVVTVENLVKRYRGHAAVDGLSFEVREGEILGILGPNGAGKTTTVEILQGLRGVDGGRIEVLGLDPTVQATALRRRPFLTGSRCGRHSTCSAR